MMKHQQSAAPHKRHHRHREGATMVEYGLMLILVAFGTIAFTALLGTALTNLFKTVTNNFFP